MFRNILLAVDGSDHAMLAARLAGEFSRLVGADLLLITAYEEVPPYLGEPYLQQAITERVSRANQIIQQALEEVGEIPGEISTEALSGGPAETILRVAENRGVDLIVMGSRGLGQLTGMLLGSQSRKVVSLAKCPVLIAR
jgi:nucleotide-binding universal stress UspA family protein